MKRILNAFLIIYLFNSCNYFIVQEKEDKSSEIIAIVNTEKLFKEDLKNVIPQNISKDDSIVLVKSFINDWAIKQLLLHKAENNNSLEVINEINHLVNDYRESLFINNYKEMLIKQQLDTVISDVEIEDFYLKSKDNFRLNEELVKIKYLHFDNKVVSKKEFLKLFKSEEIEDLEALEKQQLSFKYFQFNDSIWTQLDKVFVKTSVF